MDLTQICRWSCTEQAALTDCAWSSICPPEGRVKKVPNTTEQLLPALPPGSSAQWIPAATLASGTL
jgi:hypothetical protein